MTEFETFTLAEGESHSWFVSPLIKAELSVCTSASYIINSCRYAAVSESSSLTVAVEKSWQSHFCLGREENFLLLLKLSQERGNTFLWNNTNSNKEEQVVKGKRSC